MQIVVILLMAILINIVTMFAFRLDKLRAVAGGWRIRESTLLWLAVLGGSPGAIVARSVFRHKTRKQPFTTLLDGIAMVQAGILAGLCFARLPFV